MIFFVILVLFFIFVSFAYLFRAINGLIYTRLQVHRAWSNVDVIVQQRFNEISALVLICEKYAKYEQNSLNLIIAERDKYLSEKNILIKMSTENTVNTHLKSILLLAEQYTDLKSNQNFLQIQDRLLSLNTIIVGRKEFLNQAIAIYNTKISLFPELLFASILRYRPFDIWGY